MAALDYYRLEYNEKQGEFKYDAFSKRKENPFGWETIAMVIALDDIHKFIELVQTTYPQINSDQADSYPKTDVIRKMFNSYVGISEL